MAEYVLFYRGKDEENLPAISDGAIFVIDSQKQVRGKITNEDVNNHYGNMYVDVGSGDTGVRLHIKPEDGVYFRKKADWATDDSVSLEGIPYFIIESISQDGNEIKYIPSVAVGDGNTVVKNLPLYDLVSKAQKDNWNSKVKANAIHIDGINEENNHYTLQLLDG